MDERQGGGDSPPPGWRGAAAARPGWHGRLARLFGVGTLVLALGLTAVSCTSAIPPDNEVFFEDAPAPPPSRASAASVVGRPERGQPPLLIADGFLRAMSTLDPEAASPYLNAGSKPRIAGWADETDVDVYAKRGVVTWSEESGRAEVVVWLQREGTLSGGVGWEPGTGTRELSIQLVKEGGEWRVANPPEVPQVTGDDFRRLFARFDAYFVGSDGEHLAPEPVLLRAPPPAEVSEQAGRQLSNSARALVNELLEGPRQSPGGLRTSIPPGTEARSVSISAGVATVDLDAGFARPEGTPARLRVGQVVWTVATLYGVSDVELLVDGRPAGVMGPDRFDASGAWNEARAPMGNLLVRPGGSDEDLLFTRDGQLNSMPATGGNAVVIPFTPLGVVKSPSRSPDGGRIAFLLHTGSHDTVWIGPSQGHDGRPTLLTGELSEPSWTPDGRNVLALRAGGSGKQRGAGTALWSVEPGSPAARPRLLRLAPMPDGLVPTSVRVGPDGVSVLALGARQGKGFRLGGGGHLYRGRLTQDGIVAWSHATIAPGLGTVYSPVWAGIAKVAFIARQGGPDNTGSIWVTDVDGWGPQRVDLGTDRPPDLGDHLASDQKGERFVFTVNTANGATGLSTILRLDPASLQALTRVEQTIDADPSLATQ